MQQDQVAAKDITGGVYGEDSDDEPERDANIDEAAEVINPSKSKYDKFYEEVRLRESAAEKRIFPQLKVDP